MRHQTLTTTSIILLPVFFGIDTTARPLKFEQPYWEIYKDPVPTPEDDPYGPVEVNSYVGNYFHPQDDYVHGEDRWPNLAPPAAVIRRAEPAVVIYGPTVTPDILAPWHLLRYHHCLPDVGGYQRCHRCPLPSLVAGPSTTTVKDEMIATTMAPTIQKRELARRGSVIEDQSLTSTTTVQFSTLTSNEEATALYTGAQQWQQYLAHDAAVSPVPTQGMILVVEDSHPTLARTVRSSAISISGEPTAISTGAQQWQAYWDHDATNPKALTDEAKFALFAKNLAIPQHHITVIITLSEWLTQVHPQRKIQDQGAQEHGTAAIISMCDVMGRILPQDKIQEKVTEDLGTAIITTCKSLAQLFPRRKIQACDASPIDGDIISSIVDAFLTLNETRGLNAKAIHREAFINIMVSVGRLNKTQNYDPGALKESRIFNITALRDQYTHRNIENHTLTLHTDTQTEGPIRYIGLALPPLATVSQNSTPQQPHTIETHSEYSNISPNVSPSASAHRPALASRGMYMFQPLQEAYTWLNDMYSRATDQHPRWPYNYPDEDIYGCIYRPSHDKVAVDRIICPPGGRDWEQGLALRSVVETDNAVIENFVQLVGIGETAERRAVPMTIKKRTSWGLFQTSFGRKDEPVETVETITKRRAVPVIIKKRTIWGLFQALFGPKNEPVETVQPTTEKRAVPAGLQKRSKWEYYKDLFYNTNMEAVVAPGETAPIETGEIIDPTLISKDPDEAVDPALVEPVEPNKPRYHEVAPACQGLNAFYEMILYYAFGGCRA